MFWAELYRNRGDGGTYPFCDGLIVALFHISFSGIILCTTTPQLSAISKRPAR